METQAPPVGVKAVEAGCSQFYSTKNKAMVQNNCFIKSWAT